MAAKTPVYQRLLAGIGGTLLILSIFLLPWASVNGVDQNGWEFNSVAALYFLICGVFAIATAITGGLYGVCRPDVSLIGGTDLLNTVSMLLFIYLISDFPENATRQYGVYCGLLFTAVAAFPIADYGPLRGASWFPRTHTGEPAGAGIAER
jgi:hypothetical protein